MLDRAIVFGAILIFSPFHVSAQECGDGQRLFTHFGGQTCIPDDPQRIVTLHDQNAMLPIMELGVAPVGSTGDIVDGGHAYNRMQDHDTSDVAFVGTWREPSFEDIAALNPDLILGMPFHANQADTFSAIAPVVLIDPFDQPLDEALMQFAELVNKTDRAEDLQAELQAKADATRDRLGPLLENTTISIIEVNEQSGTFTPIPPAQSLFLITKALQPTRPEAERNLNDWEGRSFENILAHNADVLFHIVSDVGGDGSSNQHDEFLARPTVQALPVTQAGQVFIIDAQRFFGSSWRQAMHGLDQISAAMTQDGLDRDIVVE
ncbi:MAG: ABC transporter substrate-binding protein [Pseudomonadota bacterium]